MTVDWITKAINGINIEPLTFISAIIDHSLIFIAVVGAVIFFLEKDNEKRKKLIIAIVLAVAVGWSIKNIVKVNRPCGELNLKVECDGGYSFPSNHALIAFTLALGFLDRKEYPLILLFAIFTGFSRIYVGVHSFFDVAASIVLSPVVYGLVDYYWKNIKKNRKGRRKEKNG